jgi:predicted transport protein
MALSSLMLNKDIRESFDDMDFASFVEAKFNKPIIALSDEERKTAEEEYKKYIDSTNVLEYLKTRQKAFENLEGMFSASVKEYIDSQYVNVRKNVFKELLNLDKIKEIEVNLSNYVNFGNIENLIDSEVENEALKSKFQFELSELNEEWAKKNPNVVKLISNFLYKVKENSKDPNNIDEAINTLNSQKSKIYNLLDEYHTLEQS